MKEADEGVGADSAPRRQGGATAKSNVSAGWWPPATPDEQVFEPVRSSAMVPCVTSLPSWIMATRSQRRSTTSSRCEVRNIVAARRT